MELQGKAKEDFEKWFLFGETYKSGEFVTIHEFESLPKSFRYGVYVDFFDSVGYPIDIEPTIKGTFLVFFIRLDCTHINGKSYSSRPEARTAAIEKAVEIYNANHK